MTRGVPLVLALLTATAVPLAAQRVTVGLSGSAITYNEVRQAGRSSGVGASGTIGARWGRFSLSAAGDRVVVHPANGSGGRFTVLQGDLRASYTLTPLFALEVGAGRREIHPAFAAQDVGALGIGIKSESDLGQLGRVWARAIYLPLTTFDGGGDAGLALELGFGIAVGLPHTRLGVRAEYQFQRIDREVNRVRAPIQTSLARVGLELAPF